ncbi:hypothetical protein [Kitasatospora sp. NBC_01539]|uniref:hypothetical protein n=1 Tax=Kitasatospora sp. NBC_01539 TaxID=2903577 RepID=UPI0038602DED
MPERLVPSGFRRCGCGQQVGLGGFSAPGHDKAPDTSITAAAVRNAVRNAGGAECERCGYRGTPAGMRDHEKKPHTSDQPAEQ